MVFGDSKVILDWFDGKSQLKVLTLQYLMKNIIDLKASFIWIQCFHIQRQFNYVANSLSKLALGKEFGWMYFDEVQQLWFLLHFLSTFSIGIFYLQVFVFSLIQQSIIEDTYLI